MALDAGTQAETIVGYNFTSDCYTSAAALHISGTTVFNDYYTAGISRDMSNGNPAPAAIADYWRSSYNNYWKFQFTVDNGFSLRLDSVEFDSKSDNLFGPTSYDVRYSTNGSTFTSISGGWQSLSADSQWYPDITANNGGIPLSDLTGTVYIRIYGSNPTYGGQYDYWTMDNVQVNGVVIPEPSSMFLVAWGVVAVILMRRRNRSC